MFVELFWHVLSVLTHILFIVLDIFSFSCVFLCPLLLLVKYVCSLDDCEFTFHITALSCWWDNFTHDVFPTNPFNFADKPRVVIIFRKVKVSKTKSEGYSSREGDNGKES